MSIKQCIAKWYNDVRIWHGISLLCLISIVAISIHKKPIQHIPAGELIVSKDGPKQIVPRIEIKLDEVAIIKSLGWNKFKTEFSNNEEVLVYIYRRIGIPNAPQRAKYDLANMNEDQWGKFMESLSNKNAEIVKRTPFAFFTVYINGSEPNYYRNRIYCKNSTFSIPKSASYNLPAAFVTLRILNIYDTYDLLSGNREAVVLRIPEIKENVEVEDK